MKNQRIQIIIHLLAYFISCTYCPAQNLFSEISAESSNLHFSNQLQESPKRSILEYANFYNGGGVTLTDLNNDGILDIVVAGNQVGNAVYKGLGNFEFEDMTTSLPKIFSDSSYWTSSIAAADVNNDGLIDLYLANETNEFDLDKRKDIFLLNKGNFSFEDKSLDYGFVNSSRTRSASFFDYNQDGYNDLVLLIQPPNPGTFSDLNGAPWNKSEYGIHILKNIGGEKFEDVTKELGVDHPNYPNAVGISDLNNDGWADLYVTGDFESPDYLFLNQKGIHFKEISKKAFRHTSYFSMGVAISDINDDGWNDVFVVDMVAPDNYKVKSNMSGMNPKSFWETVRRGYHHQYMYNTLQLNQGISPFSDTPKFSDVAALCNVSSTDWSWSNLIADFDNDGRKDIFITNGILREIRNTDAQKKFNEYIQDLAQKFIQENPNAGDVDINDILNLEEALEFMPSNPVSNLMFSQIENLKFEDVSKKWGLDFQGYSTGAAYGDLDNDGDLDLVINNVNKPLSLYRNNTIELNNKNFIRFKISNNNKSITSFVGTKIKLTTSKGEYWNDLQLCKGMYSQSEGIIHFGLYKNEKIDKVECFGLQNIYRNFDVKDLHLNTINVLNLDADILPIPSLKPQFSFNEISKNILPGIVKHTENTFDDFEKQVLLPHQMSKFGPAIAVGDINGDKLEDFFLGGAAYDKGAIYKQLKNGSFEKLDLAVFKEDKNHEDLDAEFVDIDNDNDLDLYVVSGGNEWESGNQNYRDRIYLNEGNGTFTKRVFVEHSNFSGSVVRPFDFDQDGDIDFFVGGRLTPWSYPEPTDSKIYKNEKGKLTDVTSEIAPALSNLGMVTDAVWSDLNEDGQKDLILVGEWMPITVFLYQNSKFIQDKKHALNGKTGWWFSVEAADVDQDGDDDYIFGNLGLNYKYKASKTEPFSINYYDFDENDSKDIVLSYYNYGVEYPLRGRSCSAEQVPDLASSFPSYNEFALANLYDVYGENAIKNSLRYEVETFASYIAFNKNQSYDWQQLPAEAQISSVNEILVDDWNGDEQLDILLAGNLFSSEIETPRNDASYGLLLTFNKKEKKLEVITSSESKIYTAGDTKKMKQIIINNKKCFVVGNNDERIQVFCSE